MWQYAKRLDFLWREVNCQVRPRFCLFFCFVFFWRLTFLRAGQQSSKYYGEKMHLSVILLSNPCAGLWNVCTQDETGNLLRAAFQTSLRIRPAPGSCARLSVNSTAICKGQVLWHCSRSFLSSTPSTHVDQILPLILWDASLGLISQRSNQSTQVCISSCTSVRVIGMKVMRSDTLLNIYIYILYMDNLYK